MEAAEGMLDGIEPGFDENAGRPRPTRAEVEPAALDLIRRYGTSILSTARRYSATPEDAEDAYQRGLEILLTRAPSTSEDDLLPWLKTVVKHEAFALRRQRERAGAPTDEALEDAAGPAPSPAEQAERYERLRMGAEAMQRLKPQEVRALLLRAEGYSYKQICELTGWTYTKVNRCITEGRRSFLERVAGIEAGIECERLRPLLSALADGEAGAREMSALRTHLRSCLTCRATLREYREVPRSLAALVPPVAIGATGLPADAPGWASRWLDPIVGWAQDRAAILGVKAQAVSEAATGTKIAAVAASTAALAGGGVAAVRSIDERPDRRGADASERDQPLAGATPIVPPPARQLRPAARRDSDRAGSDQASPEPQASQPLPEPDPINAYTGSPQRPEPAPDTPLGGGNPAKGEPGAGEFGP